ncbi:uncharacterized protein [Watersipora subatra]|uniref:uncharacterized protein n=1 Tax=Watersipora subatra TaxID=2589382 RepID=UPI00355C5AE0
MSASKYVLCLVLLNIFVFSVLSLDPYTVIAKTSPIVDARRGSTFEIRCDVINRPDGKSQEYFLTILHVIFKTRWEREGTNCSDGQNCRTLIAQDRLPIDQQKYGLKYQPADTYFLIIKNVDERDEGHYQCLVHVTLYVRVTDTVFVRVVEKPTIDPLKTSSDRFVTTGKDVELTCAAYGRPTPLIKWTRAGNGMMPGGGFVKLTQKLTIPNIQSQYRGQYICTASNSLGEDSRIIDIDMNFAPEVTASPSVVSQKVGYETRLFCHVSSQPKATVSWYIGSEQVTDADADKYKVTNYDSAFDNLISKLTVYKVTATELAANISCVATNSEGRGQAPYSIEANCCRFKMYLIVICWLGLLTQLGFGEEVDGHRVTNEAIITFSIEDYQGSGETQEASIEVALFGDVAPMTVMNFLGLCRGYKKKGQFLHYVGTPVHRIVPDFVIQMGDVLKKDGTGGHSIYGPTYDDEETHLSHFSKGIIAMANTGKNTNGSQFYITLVKARWLDRNHVIFGKVIKGLNVVDDIGEIPSSKVTAFPKKKITISGCSELSSDRKWVMSEEQIYSNEDIKV